MTGRRWLAACAAALAMTIGATGCSQLPDGVDGKLTDAWAVPAEPKGYEPVDGACYATFTRGTASVRDVPPVDCAESHSGETIYTGDNPGGTVAQQFAFCEEKINTGFGRDWRSLRIEISVVLPTASAIKGGAKWIRCDAREVKDVDSEGGVTRKGRLRDSVAQLALGCFQAAGSDYTLTAVDCGQKHNTEFVGAFTATGVYPEKDSQWAPLHTRCRVLGATYLGITAAQYYTKYSNLAAVISPDWDHGQRGVRCYLYLGKTTMTGSAKGKKLTPPRYS